MGYGFSHERLTSFDDRFDERLATPNVDENKCARLIHLNVLGCGISHERLMQSNSEKKEKSLAEFMLIVALVGVLMGVFINYYLKQEAQYTKAGFSNLAQSFNTKVAAVHAQWFMDKKPSTVQLRSLNKQEKQLVSVNAFGWIDLPKQPLVCEAVWQLVMEQPLSLMKLSIAAIEVRTFHMSGLVTGQAKEKQASEQKTQLTCRYVLPNGAYFDYNRINGKVSSVIKGS